MRQPPSIDSFGAGGFRVSGQWRPGSLLILDDQPQDWRPRDLGDLSMADFAEVIAGGLALSEFVLLGTGTVQAQPPAAVRTGLRQAGLGLEFMTTANAARTWGVLVSQGRRLALALLCV